MGRIGALVYAAIALIVGALAYVFGVTSSLGQLAEASILDASDFTVNPPAPLSLVSVPAVGGALALLAIVALIVHGFGRAFSILVVGAAAIVGSQLLKENWLERPQLIELGGWNTFPSGHMTVFAVIAGGLIWALPRGARAWVGVMSAVVLGVVSWQLLEFGWHRPSDVLGAQALVVCSFAIAAAVGPRISKRKNQRGSTAPVATRVLLISLTIIGGLVLLAGLGLVFVAASTRSDALMLVAGEISLVGTSIFASRMLLVLAP